MKKVLAIAGLAAACSAFADPETVYGTTEVGILEINNSSTDCIVAVPYLELTGGNICVSNIVKTANLDVGDELYVYENGWTAWVLAESDPVTHAKYWKSVGTATIDANGSITTDESKATNEKTLVPGSAIWLKRKNPKGSFYVYGGYQQALSTEVTGGVYNLIANPLDTSFDLPGEVTGDKVKVVTSATNPITYSYSTKEGQWSYTDDKGARVRVGTLPILAGQGVWFRPKTSRTITWRSGN